MINTVRIILLICFINCFGIAYAQEDSVAFEQERFSVSVGGFFTALGTSVIVGVDDLGAGASLELEDALGLKNTAFVLRSEAQYTFGKKRNKRVSLSYLGLFRNADRALGSELTIGDVTYPTSTNIQTEFNLQVFDLSYNYGFFQDDRIRLGIGGGFYVMPIGFSVSADGNESDFFQFVAPLPVLGITTDFYLTPKWTFNQSIDFLYISFGNFIGSLTDINIGVDYQAFDRFAFGVGINSFRLNLEAQGESIGGLDFKGSIETTYAGLLFYGKYRLNYKK